MAYVTHMGKTKRPATAEVGRRPCTWITIMKRVVLWSFYVDHVDFNAKFPQNVRVMVRPQNELNRIKKSD